MRIPKYIEKKIWQRARCQEKSNSLQVEIEEWCQKNKVNLEIQITDFRLYTEPEDTRKTTLENIMST